MKYFAVIENEIVVGILVSEQRPEDDRELVELDGPLPAKPYANAEIKLVGNKVLWDLDGKSKFMRDKRNQLLADTDWVTIKALETGAPSAAWLAYRQALRDLPNQTGFPDIDFPVPPKA